MRAAVMTLREQTTKQANNAAQGERRIMSRFLNTSLAALLLATGLLSGQDVRAAAPTFTAGDPAYKGVSNAQDKINTNAPPGTGGNLSGMVNQPPVIGWATAANTVVTAPASFALATTPSDPDGTIARVDYYNGATLIGTVTATPWTFNWAGVPAGSYTLTAVATDNLGMSTTSATLTVISNAAPSVSLTAPAANTVATAPSSFGLTANAADSDGTIARVDYYANGTLIGSATAAPYSYTWSNVPAGSYSLTAIATDNYGAATTSAAVAVISNAPPTVSIASPANNAVVAAPGSFTLSADATDSDGTIAKVDYYNGATLIGSATAAPYSVTWTNVPAGIHTITAQATDNHGAAATSSAISLISDTPPAVSLTSPAANTVATAPGSFTLAATATSSMSTIAKVEFFHGATLIGTATAAPYSVTWSNVAAGSYSLTAVATDGYGISTPSAAVAVISNQAPSVSLTSPADGAQITSPNSFTLTADATDADGSIARVEFYNGATLLGTATTAPYSFTWKNVPAGSYSLTAIATDNNGAATTSAAVAVISNQAPSVSLTGPADGAQITSPNSFILTAEATDADGSIARIEFYNGATLLGTATTAPYSFTWSNVPVGSYSLTAIATDNLGGQTTSPVIGVTAIANVPPAVSLTSPTNGATATVPGSFTLTADAASTTSAVARVDFYATDNATNTSTLVGTATTASNGNYSAAWSNVALGSYTLTAVATDTLNATTTSAAVTVTVNTGIAQAYYIHADHLDTPRMITDTAGNVVWDWPNLDPFGNNVPNENPTGLGVFEFNKRYKGQYFDKETGLHYNINRDYDPSIGRYVESDPIGLRGGINTYAYVGGNPLRWADPLGLDPYGFSGYPRNQFFLTNNENARIPGLPDSRQLGLLQLSGQSGMLEVYTYQDGYYSYNPEDGTTMLLSVKDGYYEVVGLVDLGNNQKTCE
jgi:RHS repeat-associated protein